MATTAAPEPSRRNAIHGLVRWLTWDLGAQSAVVVALECALPPQPGYEWALPLRISYELSDGGLI